MMRGTEKDKKARKGGGVWMTIGVPDWERKTRLNALKKEKKWSFFFQSRYQ